jgi:hypothetical protein
MVKKPAKSAAAKTAKPAKASKVAKSKAQPKQAKVEKAAIAQPKAKAASKLGSEEAFRPPAYQRGNFGMPKRMCPFCNSTDVSPDSMGGDIMSWTCHSCGNSFPAPLEAKGGKADAPEEESEYEEMPD